MKTIFTIKEVERLVKNAYNVGFCDGEDNAWRKDSGDNFRDYKNDEDFWNKNIKGWQTKKITYVT